MRTLYPILVCLLLFTGLQNLQAQSFGDFSTLFEQLTQQQQDDFFEQLGNLDIDELNGFLTGSGAIDQLQDLLNGDLPFDEIGDLMGTFQNAGVYIEEWLGEMHGFTDEEIEILFGQFTDIENAFGDNIEGFEDAFQIFQDSINGTNFNISLGDPIDLDYLTGQLETTLEELEIDPSTGIQDIFDQVFNGEAFSNLEIAYGRKAANVSWYGDESNIGMDNLQLIRVGTVPNFTSDFESYWSFTASWSNNQFGLLTGSEGRIVEDAFNPFIFEGSFGLSYNPGITFANIQGSRLITRVGFEAATYAPPHLIAKSPVTYDNVGRTTGYGPQIATGYSISGDDLVTYVLATASLGTVHNSNYLYTNLKVEAGIKFKDSFHFSYSMGEQNWANDSNKNIETLNQFTIGVLIDSLFK